MSTTYETRLSPSSEPSEEVMTRLAELETNHLVVLDFTEILPPGSADREMVTTYLGFSIDELEGVLVSRDRLRVEEHGEHLFVDIILAKWTAPHEGLEASERCFYSRIHGTDSARFSVRLAREELEQVWAGVLPDVE